VTAITVVEKTSIGGKGISVIATIAAGVRNLRDAHRNEPPTTEGYQALPWRQRRSSRAGLW